MVMMLMLLSIVLSVGDDVIAGATLAEWRERMSVIDLADPQSARWVPGLIAVMETESVPWFTRRQAALTLGRMGETARDAVPVLRGLLDEVGDDPDTSPQLWALRALSLFGPVAKDAAPDMVRILRASSSSVAAKTSAIDALSQMGAVHPVVMPTLIDFAGDPATPVLRRAAIEAIGLNGPSAAPALPTLVRVLDDADENLRREAAAALGKLGPNGDAARFALLERLMFDEIPAVQDAAAKALGEIGPVVAGEVVPLLKADDPELRRRAAAIIGEWQTRARPWQSAIQAAWDDESSAVRLAALEASWKITRRGGPIASRVAAELAHEDRQHRIAAVRLLTRMGPEARSAERTVRDLSASDRPEVRLAAEEALESLSPDE